MHHVKQSTADLNSMRPIVTQRLFLVLVASSCAVARAPEPGRPRVYVDERCAESSRAGSALDCSVFRKWLLPHRQPRVLGYLAEVLQAEGFALARRDSTASTITIVTAPSYAWPLAIVDSFKNAAEHPGIVVRVQTLPVGDSTAILVWVSSVRPVPLVDGDNPQLVLALYTVVAVQVALERSLLQPAP